MVIILMTMIVAWYEVYFCCSFLTLKLPTANNALLFLFLFSLLLAWLWLDGEEAKEGTRFFFVFWWESNCWRVLALLSCVLRSNVPSALIFCKMKNEPCIITAIEEYFFVNKVVKKAKKKCSKYLLNYYRIRFYVIFLNDHNDHMDLICVSFLLDTVYQQNRYIR